MDALDDLPPLGRLLEGGLARLGISQNEAGRRTGMTGSRWRQIVKGQAGEMTSARGVKTLARMAGLVEVEPEQLEEVGRPDVADRLRTGVEPERELSAQEIAERLDEHIAYFKRRDAEREERMRHLEKEVERLKGKQPG